MTKEQMIKHLEAAQTSLRVIIKACESLTAKINTESNEVSGDGYARSKGFGDAEHLRQSQQDLDESVRRYDENNRRGAMDRCNGMPSNKRILRFRVKGNNINVPDAPTFFIMYRRDHGLKHQFCTQPIIKN